MLKLFARWFASASGVWQTVAICTVVVILEMTHVIHDPQGFWLLYWCTVYSAVTQPILAYTNKQEGLEDDAFFCRIEELEVRILNALQVQGAARLSVRQETEGSERDGIEDAEVGV